MTSFSGDGHSEDLQWFHMNWPESDYWVQPPDQPSAGINTTRWRAIPSGGVVMMLMENALLHITLQIPWKLEDTTCKFHTPQTLFCLCLWMEFCSSGRNQTLEKLLMTPYCKSDQSAELWRWLEPLHGSRCLLNTVAPTFLCVCQQLVVSEESQVSAECL